MRLRFYRILFPLLLLLLNVPVFSQVNDAQLWTSIALKKKIIKPLSVSFTQDFRFTENVSELGSFFSEVGLLYKINKNWRISGDYRFSYKIQLDNTYSRRHRYNFDLSYRIKYYHFGLILRTRFESEYKKVNSSETGHIPDNYSRNKLTLKYDITRRISPYASVEAFIPLNNPKIKGIDNMRYSLGLEWEFVKNSAIDVYYMIQREYQVKNPERDFVAGIGYSFSF